MKRWHPSVELLLPFFLPSLEAVTTYRNHKQIATDSEGEHLNAFKQPNYGSLQVQHN